MALNNKLNFNFFTKKLISMNPVKFLRWLPLSLRQKYRQKRAEVVVNFLLSTNFFHNHMNEQLEIKYNGYVYEMYKHACTNPLSGLQYR